ncbi:hypothetical protein GJAV_G00186640 [Gymnothorax javanicus]|nr:hypothetical protein GJAV_G00186640 [Gymnothorax javanicus]
MCDGEVRVVPLHRRMDLVEECADLVNSEWQRSRGARIHALQKSCQDFPVCLVLIQGTGSGEKLLGHARLSRVVGHSSSLFVETVVVSKAQRGKGYGRTLMEGTERYARARGFRRLCLTTHDKQHFYAHLGYVLSRPVQSAGAMTSFVPMEVLQMFSRMPITESPLVSVKISDNSSANDSPTFNSVTPVPHVAHPCIAPLPPSPPLPPPPPSSSLPPPPPPLPFISSPPPPPPDPHRTPTHPKAQTLLETPYKDLKGAPIFWMHKDI